MGTCLSLQLEGVGLEELDCIEQVFPLLQVLHVNDNKISSVKTIEILKKLPDIAEVNLKDNPVCIHENFNDMMLETLPNIEVVNELAIKEAGQRYKESKEKILRQLRGAHYKKGQAPTEGDDLILED